jgi:3'-phosphoadenosine 5'-phosphosulfate sulfotransferase (PAPS reductase)/FAD synthetase
MRCKRCIMPEEYPGITFNSEGVCSYCTQYDPNMDKNRVDLLGKDKLIERIRSVEKRGEYDCVIPLSGGKDSTYVLYYAVKELGLKPVAVTYEFGFRTQMAVENVQNACEALDVPCVTEQANRGIQDRLLRQSLRISKTVGSFVLTCMNCGTLIRAIPIKVAKQRGIPFVLFGDSVRESVRLAKMRSVLKTAKYEDIRSNRPLTIMIEKVTKLKEANMTPFKFMRIFPRLVCYRLLGSYQILSLGVPFKNAIFPNTGSVVPKKGPQMIHFYDYVDWDPVEGVAVLERELGWKHPPDRIGRFDCSLNCFGGYRALQKGGISANGIISCNLIREGLMSREEALEKEQLEMHTVVEKCQSVINELGLNDFIVPNFRDETQDGRVL